METEDKEATTGRRHPTWKSLTMILSEAFRLAGTFRARWVSARLVNGGFAAYIAGKVFLCGGEHRIS